MSARKWGSGARGGRRIARDMRDWSCTRRLVWLSFFGTFPQVENTAVPSSRAVSVTPAPFSMRRSAWRRAASLGFAARTVAAASSESQKLEISEAKNSRTVSGAKSSALTRVGPIGFSGRCVQRRLSSLMGPRSVQRTGSAS